MSEVVVDDYVADVVNDILLNDLAQVDVVLNVDVDGNDTDVHLDKLLRVGLATTPVTDAAVNDDDDDVDNDCVPESDVKVLLEVVDVDAECECR